MALGAGFEPARSLLNRQMPFLLATPEQNVAAAGLEPATSAL